MDFEKQSIGTEDFEEHIKLKNVYIDKTSYLPDLYGEKVHPNGMRYEDKVFLFTRPRRFGKSLTMSMIKSFFEINYANPEDNSKAYGLFKNLAITGNKAFCEKYMGKYPVVFISLKEVDGKTFSDALKQLTKIIGSACLFFQNILGKSNKQSDSNLKDLQKLVGYKSEDIDWNNASDLTNIKGNLIFSLKLLTAMLKDEYNRNTIVIVDEYDVPLQKATVNGYYDDMLYVIRGMFSSVFKTNSCLEKGFVTGCLRISHESIFTGINNFSIYTVNDEAYNKFIGFTHEETVQLLKDNKLISRQDEVMSWYDGYNFAGAKMLCPWSVLKFCEGAGASANPQTFAPKNYWINTSGNDIMKICITKPNARDSLRLQNLLDGNTEIVKPTEFSTYPEISYKTGFDVMMGMMIHTGYLTVINTDEKGAMEVKIPNNEIKDSFRKNIEAIYCDDNIPWFEKVNALKAALFKNDKNEVQDLINELLINFVSVRNTAHESYYHGFLSGVLSLTVNDPEEIKSDMESGQGFSDLRLISDLKKNVIIIEFKKIDKGESIEDVCAEALKQIEEKQYAYPYEQKNYRILKYGIGFYGKECWVAVP